MEKLLTVHQIAKLIKVEARTIREYAKKGKIRFKRNPVNNYRMFSPLEVVEDLKKLNVIDT